MCWGGERRDRLDYSWRHSAETLGNLLTLHPHFPDLLFLKPTANIVSAGISPISLGSIHVPAAPHTGLSEHKQPRPNSGSSQRGFQPPQAPSCSPFLAPLLLEDSEGSNSWENFLVLDYAMEP